MISPTTAKQSSRAAPRRDKLPAVTTTTTTTLLLGCCCCCSVGRHVGLPQTTWGNATPAWMRSVNYTLPAASGKRPRVAKWLQQPRQLLSVVVVPVLLLHSCSWCCCCCCCCRFCCCCCWLSVSFKKFNSACQANSVDSHSHSHSQCLQALHCVPPPLLLCCFTVRVSCSPSASVPLLLFSCSVHLPPLPHLWSMPESIAAPRLAIVVVGSFPCTRCPSAQRPCTRTRWKLWGV